MLKIYDACMAMRFPFCNSYRMLIKEVLLFLVKLCSHSSSKNVKLLKSKKVKLVPNIKH